MTPRSFRRAQERKALKQARKAEQRPLAPNHISDVQFAANRANAQLSTGPKTAEGKAKVSLNAVKGGLTGRTVLLPGDDLEAYHASAERIRRTYNPVGDEEDALVQSLIDTEWRLNRIPELESAIYALAMRRLEPEFADIADPAAKMAMLRGEAYLQHSRDFSNLSIQETRLLRRRAKDTAALADLQRQRREAESKARVKVAPLAAPAQPSLGAASAMPHSPNYGNGFEFSLSPAGSEIQPLNARRFEPSHEEKTRELPNVV